MIPAAWLPYLRPVTEQPFYSQLMAQVETEYANHSIFPPRKLLFSALELTAPEEVKVVILGQDPYHEQGQANGLAFSVAPGTPYPPSLRNIFTELKEDVGTTPPNGDLSDWAKQGVLLLNTVLTVREGQANSHKDLGWQKFTDEVIAAMAQLPQPIVFILWGAQAQKKKPLITASAYPRCILASPHPSPLSSYRGFFGSKPFSKSNQFLTAHGLSPIAW